MAFIKDNIILAQPQQSRQLDPELGAAQPQLVDTLISVSFLISLKTLILIENLLCGSHAEHVNNFFSSLEFPFSYMTMKEKAPTIFNNQLVLA
jgi:hypothetical protein